MPMSCRRLADARRPAATSRAVTALRDIQSEGRAPERARYLAGPRQPLHRAAQPASRRCALAKAPRELRRRHQRHVGVLYLTPTGSRTSTDSVRHDGACDRSSARPPAHRRPTRAHRGLASAATRVRRPHVTGASASRRARVVVAADAVGGCRRAVPVEHRQHRRRDRRERQRRPTAVLRAADDALPAKHAGRDHVSRGAMTPAADVVRLRASASGPSVVAAELFAHRRRACVGVRRHRARRIKGEQRGAQHRRGHALDGSGIEVQPPSPGSYVR